MKLYDASTDAVKQGGTRRGANMGILRVDHPDIMDFITCKEDLTQVTNFNISVGITRKFMEAVKAGASYDLIDPSSGSVVGQMEARTVWDRMILGAWRTGEPGVFFVDEANRYNPVPHLGAYEATNPCGEQPLLPYDVCNLGSINVGYYVRDGQMDWSALKRDVQLSVHFLDNIIDVNKYPLPEIDALSKRIRRIGFGIMGFADALVRLGIAYNSIEGVEFGRQLQRFVDVESKRESERLANERARSRGSDPSGAPTRPARATRVATIRPMRMLRNVTSTRSLRPNDLHHRGLLIGHRAAFCRCIHAQPGRRADAGRERRFCGDRETGRLVLRRADGEDREGRSHPLRRGAGAGAARVRHGARHHARVARENAGGLPGELRFGDLQDEQFPTRCYP
jgi:ribonucleoside-diphosphate reductase alpha chain